MTLTLLPVPRRYDHALQQIKADTTRHLRQEIEEERISAELIEKHNRHLVLSRAFKQTGGVE